MNMKENIEFSVGYAADYIPIWILEQFGQFTSGNNKIRIFKSEAELLEFGAQVLASRGMSFSPMGRSGSG